MFQFTHPGRGATRYVRATQAREAGFNSRTPGGVRPYGGARKRTEAMFQFTHPGRGAT